MLYGGSLRLPFEMLAYLAVGLAVMLAVSPVTRPVAEEKLRRLYRALNTPVGDDEGSPPAPFEVPEGSRPEPGRKLVDHPSLEIRIPGRGSLAGFGLVCALVAALVGAVYWLAHY